MIALTLKRFSTDNDGTYGVILAGTKPILLTLEESWKGNRQNESCIPSGLYTCKRVISPNFGETFEITGVVDRDDILFHPGNTEINTLGCILTGSEWGTLKAEDDDTGETEDQAAVLESQKAFKKFMSYLQGHDQFKLWIVWANTEEVT
jgi:hypothetical protein